MLFQATVLSAEEKAAVHANSLRILDQVGVRFHGRKALEVLKRGGARVDADTRIVRMPRELVEHTLSAAPKSFVLGARNPEFDYALPSPVTRYCMDGTGAFAVDFYSGERRYGTSKDIENCMRVLQGLDMAVMAWAPTCASNAPAHSRALHEFFAMVKYCSKHGQHELHSVEQVPYLVAGLRAVVGSEEALKARKNYSLVYCPVAPLVHDGAMCDAYLELGEYDLPIMVMPMPVPGSTGPASLFSSICLANAEMLSALVVFELAHPSRPLIYSSASGSMDFRSGGFLGGTPEMVLQTSALVEMGRFYGLPSTAAGCTSDAREPGAEAVLDKVITTLPAVLAGADIVIGIGEIETDQTLVLEQMVVDNEIAHLCQRLREGVNTEPARDLFEDIAQVGPGGNFLMRKSTVRLARSAEFYLPGLISRSPFEAWLELGKPSMYAAAREKVGTMLEGPVVDPLPDAVAAELDAILRAADAELAG